ncbi:hypothetical protein F3Y22_tig00116958pilonHSYRG00334 [Hibiscus syriacus]|uniref:Uncharacterized protein n=1 Tax=Hibiscus syriacus TaxID=106335 RepID=A0A6A2WXK2_HIBSY|nr:hypothetical protein F3Y22_tig00116958pilonHSYRG00334 [Hibiscus syriacus]
MSVGKSPVEEFTPLATAFNCCLLIGVGPASLIRWHNEVGDQRLPLRAVERLERSVDQLPANSRNTENLHRKSVNEPTVAYGPPGSSGELNVGVIASSVPLEVS